MKKIYLLFIILLFTSELYPLEVGSAYEGTRFYISFMQNENYIQANTGLLLQLFITSKYNTSVTITAPYFPPQTFLINKDSVFTAYIDPKLEMYYSEVALRNAVEITSDMPISVMVYSSQWKSTDSYTAVPVDRWGKKYVVMSQPNDQYIVPDMIPPEDSLRLAEPRSSEFMIMAKEDSTVIEFKPRSITMALKQTYRYYQQVLNKGECYLVQSYKTQKGTGDLTGTIVTSNKPIGFLSGHVRSAIPQFLGEQWDSKNHLVEMLQPVESWGRKFITVPLLPPSFMPYGDMIRLIGYYPETNITLRTANGFKSYFLKDSGDYISIPNFAETALWQSDKPLQIGQYLMHSGRAADSYAYDPAMVSVPPLEQFVQRVLFNTPGNPPENPDQFLYHFVLLIADQASLNSLTIDGSLVSSKGPIMTQRISGTNYYYVRLQVTRGRHEVICQNGSFSGILYGVGDADAYAHIIGSSISNPFIADTIPPVIKIDYNCDKITGYVYEKTDRINTGIDYVQVILDSTYNFSWKDMTVSDTTTYVEIFAQVIDITQDAKFVIDIRDKYGNGSRYRFIFNKLNIDVPKEIDYQEVDSRDSVCRKFIIANNGNDTIVIKSSYLSSIENRLIYTLNKKLPMKLAPGDTLKGTICFEPNGDTTALNSQLVFVYNCDLMSRIPIKATILNYELQTLNHDFGIVRIGDTLCSTIGIVNHGNSDIIIDSVNYNSAINGFVIDTAGIFPVTLKSGDTLHIVVCFHPDSLIDYASIILWRNNKLSNTRSYVTGTGGAPNIESVLIDWGRRRVGTTNDSTFMLRNTGNYPAWLKFRQIEVQSDDFNKNEIMGVNYFLKPGDSAEIFTSYIPVNPISSYFSASLETDWSLHREILIELKGEGTLPVIITNDIDFGKVRVLSINDTIAKFITSSGNEILHIDTIFLASPDFGDFTADPSLFSAFSVDTGTTLSNAFSFNPKSLGYQERIFGVVHDAMPGYQRDTAYFRLMGTALPLDTLSYSVKLTTDGDLINCQTSKIQYELKNLGNVPFDITNINLIPVGLEASWINNPTFPMNVIQGADINLEIQAKPIEKANVSLTAETTINDTIKDVKKLDIDVITTKLVLNSSNAFKSRPGDSVSFTVSGTFPIFAEDDFQMIISGKMNMQDYMITNLQPILEIDNGNTKQLVTCDLLQTIDGFTITPRERIKLINDNTKWVITLKLFTFLNDNRHPRIEIAVQTDKCFDSGNEVVISEIGEVCVINMRAIVASNKALSVNLTPNPVSDNLTADITVNDNTDAEINVFDNLGKKCYYSKKIFLNKGKNSRIFEFSSLTNGVYLFNIATPEINKSIIFIILK